MRKIVSQGKQKWKKMFFEKFGRDFAYSNYFSR